MLLHITVWTCVKNKLSDLTKSKKVGTKLSKKAVVKEERLGQVCLQQRR